MNISCFGGFYGSLVLRRYGGVGGEEGFVEVGCDEYFVILLISFEFVFVWVLLVKIIIMVL